MRAKMTHKMRRYALVLIVNLINFCFYLKSGSIPPWRLNLYAEKSSPSHRYPVPTVKLELQY